MIKKYMCIKTCNFSNRRLSTLYKGNIYDSTLLNSGGYMLLSLLYQKYVVPLEEWREQQIAKILDS